MRSRREQAVRDLRGGRPRQAPPRQVRVGGRYRMMRHLLGGNGKEIAQRKQGRHPVLPRGACRDRQRGETRGARRGGQILSGMYMQYPRIVDSACHGGRVKPRRVARVLHAQAVTGEVNAVQVKGRTVRQPNAEPDLVAGWDVVAEGGAEAEVVETARSGLCSSGHLGNGLIREQGSRRQCIAGVEGSAELGSRDQGPERRSRNVAQHVVITGQRNADGELGSQRQFVYHQPVRTQRYRHRAPIMALTLHDGGNLSPIAQGVAQGRHLIGVQRAPSDMQFIRVVLARDGKIRHRGQPHGSRAIDVVRVKGIAAPRVMATQTEQTERQHQHRADAQRAGDEPQFRRPSYPGNGIQAQDKG